MAITKRPGTPPKGPGTPPPDVEALIARGGAPSRPDPEPDGGVAPDRPCMVQLRPEGWLVNQWDAVRHALDKKNGRVRPTSRHTWLLQVINDHATAQARELGLKFSGRQLPASER